MSEQPYIPPARIRVVGQAISRLVARFPASWRLLRGPARRFWDGVAAGWDERVDRGPERMEPLRAALEHLPEAPRRILDLGTGTGAGALELARLYPDAEVTGVDFSPEMVRLAREKAPPELGGRLRFEVADAAALPFGDGAFDLVAQVSVPVFFDEVARVSAARGHVVVVSSLGAATPFHTPLGALRSGFERRGMREVARGSAGRGLYFVAGKRGSA